MIDLNTKQQNVLAVIRRNPEAANDDMLLYELYWTEVDNWKPGTSMRHCTRPETISRRRRELYNMGLISYTEAKDKEREEAFLSEKYKPQAISWLKDDCEA